MTNWYLYGLNIRMLMVRDLMQIGGGRANEGSCLSILANLLTAVSAPYAIAKPSVLPCSCVYSSVLPVQLLNQQRLFCKNYGKRHMVGRRPAHRLFRSRRHTPKSTTIHGALS